MHEDVRAQRGGHEGPEAGIEISAGRGPRLVKQIQRGGHAPTMMEVYVGSDWVGRQPTRRSTSGGAMMFGATLLRAWSTTQAVIAHSIRELGCYAAL